jgi:hypothetical protein
VKLWVFGGTFAVDTVLYVRFAGIGAIRKLVSQGRRDLDKLPRYARRRDELRDQYDLIGLEMEAAGIINTLPTGVIRGVCDYGDGQKNKDWQPYAAAVAAVYAKEILLTTNPKVIQTQRG